MGLEDLKRWHWAGIGLVVGLAFGAVRVAQGPDLDSGVVRRLNSLRQFERGLIQRPDARDKISDIVIYPTEPDGRIQLIFKQVRQTNQRTDPKDPSSPLVGIVDKVRFDVTEPYTPQSVLLDNPKPDLTVREYLDGLKQKFPDAQISYRYAWEAVPANTILLCALGGVVLIGGIWPSIIGLLTGAGIWGPRPRQKDEYDLDRFAGGAEPVGQSAATASDEEKKRLEQQMEDDLLAKLDGFGANGGTRRDSIDEEVEVRALTGGPLEGGQEPTKRPEEDKNYKGDFYPVARPAGKKDE